MLVGSQAPRREPTPENDSDDLDDRAVVVCQDLIQRFESTPDRTAADAQALVDRIHDVAAEMGHVTGKWLLFLSQEAADHAWPQIAAGTFHGSLGSFSAKICRAESGDIFVTCVYQKDFADKESVGQLLLNLRNLDIHPSYTQHIYFKADIMTECGIYNGWWPGTRICRWSARCSLKLPLPVISTISGHAMLAIISASMPSRRTYMCKLQLGCIPCNVMVASLAGMHCMLALDSHPVCNSHDADK